MLLLNTHIDMCVCVQACVGEKEARHGQPPAPALSSLIKDSRRGREGPGSSGLGEGQ